jgi:DNA-binding CsgD family transcriptional regulator
VAAIPWKRILDYLGEVGAERDVQSLCWRALVALDGLVPSDGGVLHMTNDARDILPGSRIYRFPQDVFQEYVSYYMYQDPGRLGYPRGIRAAGVSWLRDFGHSEIVDDYLNPIGMRSSGGVFLYDAAGRLFAFANIHRSSPRGFSQDEITTLTAAQAHVTNLVAAYTATSALDAYTPAELAESHRLLSPREAEVARLVCRRLSASQIGSVLHISPRTVEQHVQRIYGKLGVHGKHELLRVLLPVTTGGGNGSGSPKPRRSRSA